jgi:hypothetical protein
VTPLPPNVAAQIEAAYKRMAREKELAFDAQLSATEIVRRCERRIGELVREGQRNGTVRTERQGGGKRLVVRDLPERASPTKLVGAKYRSELGPLYAMGDAAPEEFEQAISNARAEGNLSRANVVRCAGGSDSRRYARLLLRMASRELER